MPFINGIFVKELYRPGVTETAGLRDPTTATKAYLVDNWFDRYTVANGLLGLTSYTGHTVGIAVPLPYPDSPNIHCLSIAIRGVGSFSQGPNQCAWASAIIECNFGLGNFDISLNNDPGGQNSFDPTAPLIYANQSLSWGGQVIEIPGKALKYAGTGIALDVGFPMFVGVLQMNLTLMRLPYMPPGTARILPGSVNQFALFGCAPKTLRFDGFQTERQYSFGGTTLQDVSMSFAYRPQAAWDQSFNTFAGLGWTTVTYFGNPPLNVVDLSTLIPTAYFG